MGVRVGDWRMIRAVGKRVIASYMILGTDDVDEELVVRFRKQLGIVLV